MTSHYLEDMVDICLGFACWVVGKKSKKIAKWWSNGDESHGRMGTLNDLSIDLKGSKIRSHNQGQVISSQKDESNLGLRMVGRFRPLRIGFPFQMAMKMAYT